MCVSGLIGKTFKSLFGRHGQLSDDECPWTERLSNEDIFERFSTEVKETVLHNEWWKSPESDLLSNSIESDLLHLYENRSSERLQDFLEEAPVEPDDRDKVYMSEDDDDYYDTINESEIEPILGTKKEVQQNRRRLPLPPVRKQCLTSLPKIPPPEHIPTNESTTDISNISEREDMDRCFEYSEMVKIFRPLIVQNLLVHDILPHLPFLENHDDMYTEMKNHSPKNAVVSLLNELERSKVLGKWQKFIDALSACGYTYIVDNIRGYKFISHQYQTEYIRKLTPKLSKMIEPAELLPYLLAKDIISDSDNENIQREDTNRGNIAASVLLLDRITRKHRYWYKLFMEALLEAGMEDVAADLQIPNLLENKRTKVTDVFEYDVPYALPPCPSPETHRTRVPPPETEQSPEIKVDSSAREVEHLFNDIYGDGINHNESCNDTYDDTAIHFDEKDQRPVFTPNVQALPALPLRSPKPLPICTNACCSQNSVSDNGDCLQKAFAYASVPIPHAVGLHRDGTKETVNIGMANKGNDTKHKDLIDNIVEMKKERQDILFEVDLLEEKSTIHEEVIYGLRKRRKLREEIILQEKEKQVLQSDGLFQEEKTVTDDETDAYYPTRETVKTENEQHRYKRTIDYRPSSEEGNLANSSFLSLNADSPLSTVQLYSPTFDSKSKISQLFEQDSGIGRDIEL